ncbi:unnamed protein product [Lasius platythorax]|uniref:Methyltransferase type 11 domain-containing protein n=1 Tax=Lasius platythorax TaxID=488582 RepID=A0AAV2NA17_9HYME
MELAEDYVADSSMQYRDTSDLVDEFSRELSQMEGKCLDIGCGPGRITKEMLLTLLPEESKIVGADISHTMINYARNCNSDERISYIVLDIETSHLPNDEIEKYHNAVSFYCLHWCNDICRAFENIHKLLRPKGKALIMFLGYHFGFEAYTRLKQNPRFKPYLHDAHRYVPFFQRNCSVKNMRASLQTMLKNIGFKILHCTQREKSFRYSRESLKNHAYAVNPFINRFPDDKIKNEFLEQLINEIMSQNVPLKNKNNEDYIILRYQLLIAFVQKPPSTA